MPRTKKVRMRSTDKRKRNGKREAHPLTGWDFFALNQRLTMLNVMANDMNVEINRLMERAEEAYVGKTNA